jgi:hypothetical protein
MAIMTGGQVFSSDKGMKLDKFSWDWFGTARVVTITKDQTTIVDGKGNFEKIESRIDELQAQIAAQIQSGIAGQRAQAAGTLANLGQGGLGQSIGAAGQGITAAMTPQQLYNQYASVIFGTPSGSYNPNFSGTQGQTSGGTSFGIKI